jgi:hypothetical protein
VETYIRISTNGGQSFATAAMINGTNLQQFEPELASVFPTSISYIN